MQSDFLTIRELAYQIWQQRGCPDGTAEEDWLEAERRLSLAAVEPAAATKTTRHRTKGRRTQDPIREAKPPTTPTPSSPRQ
ncbi:MAG: DUF2934 domain-containing protein [Steroidobacteraceae bacterium]